MPNDTDLPGFLKGKFKFKTLSNGATDKTKVLCVLCNKEFAYHRSSSSMKYHLNSKHIASSAVSTTPDAAGKLRQTTLTENRRKLSVTTHFIDRNWTLQSFTLTVLKTETQHYSDACAEQFLTVADKWNITEKVTTIGTDSARNMVAAARKLPFDHIQCAEDHYCLPFGQYVTELLGGETYVSCSAVLPAFCHLSLSSSAHKYLATPATTVACERLFSLAGNIVQKKKRASLNSENFTDINVKWLRLKSR
ncbi:E3 SUMO-protein ligase ZBED1-like [Tachysurus ichikawai]